MRVLVTGGAGFIGSHLVDLLIQDGHSLTVLDNLETGRIENLEGVQKSGQLTFVNGSVLDSGLIDQRCVADVDFTYHLAAAVSSLIFLEAPCKPDDQISAAPKMFWTLHTDTLAQFWLPVAAKFMEKYF